MDRRPVLRDAVADAALLGDGWTTLPFLSASEVRRLLDAYAALVPRDETGVQLDVVRPDRGLVRRLSDEIHAVVAPHVAAAFTDHEPVLTAFIVKHPGPGTDFYLHRDVPVNDERTTRCFTAWIPLVDVGADLGNGGLGVVPGSEALPSGHHGFDATALAAPFDAALRAHLHPVDLAAGHALVYDARVLHASAENRSDASRPAIGCLLGRRSEPLVHVVPTGRRHRRVYAIDRDFFVDHHPAEVVATGMPPGYELVDEFDDDATCRPEDVAAIVGGTPPVAAVPVPADLADAGIGAAVLADEPSGIPVPDTDLVVGADDLGPLGTAVAGADVRHHHGGVGHLALRAGGRTLALPPPAIALSAEPRRGRPAGLDLLALDPGARLVLAVPDERGHRRAVAVLDAPQVRAGVGGAAGAAMLVPGRSVTLPAGAPVTLWNDGPGRAVVLIRHSVERTARRRGRGQGG